MPLSPRFLQTAAHATPVMKNFNSYRKRNPKDRTSRNPFGAALEDPPHRPPPSPITCGTNDMQKELPLGMSHNHDNVDIQVVLSDVTGSTALTTGTDSPQKVARNNNILLSTDDSNDQPTSWWLAMVRRMEQKHAQEKQSWQADLKVALSKNTAYKTELKEQISSQLTWLEDRMMAPDHVIPGISRQSTATTATSQSTAPEQRSNTHVTQLNYGPVPTTVSNSSVAGVEVTLDSAARIERLQELEGLLAETVAQHEHERHEWVRTLKEAAAANTKGEQLSAQQQEQLKELQRQLDSANQKQKKQWKEMSAQQQEQLKQLQHQVDSASQKQKKQWKEKTRVLQELLELTEQQHSKEKLEWKQEQDTLESTVSQLIADKSELVEKSEKAAADKFNFQHAAAEWKEKAAACQHELAEWKNRAKVLENSATKTSEQLETELQNVREQYENELSEYRKDVVHANKRTEELEQQLENAKREAETFKAQAADFTEQQATVNIKRHSIPRHRSNSPIPPRHSSPSPSRSSTPLSSASGRMEWDEKLDRAMAERDLYQQEAAALQKQLAEEKQKHAADLKQVLNRTPSKAELEREESDMMSKYREAVEKHSDLVNRFKKIEDQRANDRGSWKLQLEAALAETRAATEEKKTLERALTELAERHSHELHQRSQDLSKTKESLRAVENEMERRCQELIEKHFEELEALEKQTAEKHYLEVNELKDRLQEVEEEHERSVRDLRLQYEIHESQDAHRQVLEMQEEHATATKEWSDTLEATQSENRDLIDKCHELSKNLADLKRLHGQATKKYDRALIERKNFKDELDELRRHQGDSATQQEITVRLDRHQSVFLNAVDELREDVVAVRQTLEASAKADKAIENANYNELRNDLVQIQSSLNDAVAELTLEADAMIDSREALKSVASGASMSFKDDFLQQQDRLLEQVEYLRDNVSKALEGSSNNRRFDGEPFASELVEQLQRKEAALATAQTELKHCMEKLEAEIAVRQKAEAEVANLHDQADAYEEELMDMQSNNTKLIKQLHAAGLNIDAALLARQMPTAGDGDSTIASSRPHSRMQDSSPLLDDALALAEGLTDIVHGRGKFERESSAMEMLESMSEMIDGRHGVDQEPTMRHDSGGTTSPSRTPRSRNCKFYDESSGAVEIVDSGCNEAPPRPVETPLVNKDSNASSNDTSLQLVVEQLYGRCQLLERERVEMMEVTLDLLESAREANAAELEAALSTARRMSTEEIMRIRQRNRMEQERIFHKLCSRCVIEGQHLSSPTSHEKQT